QTDRRSAVRPLAVEFVRNPSCNDGVRLASGACYSSVSRGGKGGAHSEGVYDSFSGRLSGSQGITNQVVDTLKIEVNRRTRPAKTDRLARSRWLTQPGGAVCPGRPACLTDRAPAECDARRCTALAPAPTEYSALVDGIEVASGAA